MKKITRRSYFAMIIALALVAGLIVYVARLWKDGRDWAMLRANESVFSQGILDTGTLTDRNGTVLAKAGGGVYSYADDETVRRACFHAVGDYAGNVGTGALSVYDWRLAGYDFVGGVTSKGGEGATVKLSIDSNLNAVAYNALAGRKGAVLVSNYKTGEILCMVSTPSYDPKSPPDVSGSAYEGVYVNRCLGATVTPGSVFKLVTLAAAIENIPDLYERSFYCGGSVNVGGTVINCTGTHGQQTIEQALAHSCNCAFSELSQELGAEKLEKYAKKFGLCESLSVSDIDTAAGSFEKADTGTGNLSWSGIGQHNDLVSPIAMLRFVSAIANGGVVREPVLLKNEFSSTTRIMPFETSEKIGEMMSYNISYAYGAEKFPNLKICAKTGTAEVGDGSSHAWMVGYLDDISNPLAFTVFIEKGGGGLANAGPIVNAVLQAAVKNT
ncbi:MAG: penicillin-binding transpeptidase domain-containing protein [Oscillospiraceae bacterium]